MVTTYKVNLEGTYDGKDASGVYNAGSVWEIGERRMDGHFPHQRESGSARQIAR